LEFNSIDPIEGIIDSVLHEQSRQSQSGKPVDTDMIQNDIDFHKADVDLGILSIFGAEHKNATATIAESVSGKDTSFLDSQETPTPPEDVIVTGQRVTYRAGTFIGGSAGIAGGDGSIFTHEDPAIYNTNTGHGEEYIPRFFSLSHVPEEFIDKLAVEIRDLIVAQPDVKDREYGAIIYLNSSTGLVEAYLVKGTTEDVRNGRPPSVAYTGAILSEISQIAGGRGNIIGMIHSHPDNYYTDRRSSQQELSGADAAGFAELRNFIGNSGYTPVMRQYTIGHGGDVFEHSIFARSGSRGVEVGG
jgi:hypothetical protein